MKHAAGQCSGAWRAGAMCPRGARQGLRRRASGQRGRGAQNARRPPTAAPPRRHARAAAQLQVFQRVSAPGQTRGGGFERPTKSGRSQSLHDVCPHCRRPERPTKSVRSQSLHDIRPQLPSVWRARAQRRRAQIMMIIVIVINNDDDNDDNSVSNTNSNNTKNAKVYYYYYY